MLEPMMLKCQLCDHSHQAGPHRWDGRKIPAYNLWVCNGCFNSNHDGWGPALEPAFVAHMVRVDIALPARNDDGWYPRGD